MTRLIVALAAAVVVGTAFLGVLYVCVRRLKDAEPYAAVLRLSSREKLRFFRLLLSDPRVPVQVKLIPLLMALYLASPIDLVPDFIPVLGYVDDVVLLVAALAMIVRLTPEETVAALVGEARRRPP